MTGGGLLEKDDEHWMQQALHWAHRAERLDEVPVGAVLVKDRQLVAAAHNRPISRHDPTAHAEILVLRLAARRLKNYRLPGTTLYVTLEPCCMCVGAMIHARIERLVFGAFDPKTGAVAGRFSLLGAPEHNHRVQVQGGVCETECSHLLSSFFQRLRHRSRKS